tara:strand:+ start:5544 stop:5813 length:270 start_codon:yes stop_codon:yes gene_type:complete
LSYTYVSFDNPVNRTAIENLGCAARGVTRKVAEFAWTARFFRLAQPFDLNFPQMIDAADTDRNLNKMDSHSQNIIWNRIAIQTCTAFLF